MIVASIDILFPSSERFVCNIRLSSDAKDQKI